MSTWTFGADDEDAFETAKNRLTSEFETWLRSRHVVAAGAVSDAELLLDWRYGYGDGDLVAWTTADLDEFLLAWMPRKVMLPKSVAAGVPANIARFITFLAETRLLSGRSSSVRSLDRHLSTVTPKFLRAFEDKGRHGLGKSMLVGLDDLGVSFDPDDPSSLQAAMQAFNALPETTRFEMLGRSGAFGPELDDPDFDDPFDGLTDGLELPPLHEMDPQRLRAAALETGVLRRLAEIATFCGDGRKLTATGKLRPEDGRRLAELLGVDEKARRGAKLRSTDDLSSTTFFLDWAAAVNATRKSKGTLAATATWKRLTPEQQLAKAFSELLRIGPLTLGYPRGLRAYDVDDLLDGGVTAMLMLLFHLGGEALPFDVLDELAQEAATSELRGHPLRATVLAGQVRRAMADLWMVLGETGIIAPVEAEIDLGHDSKVELTPEHFLRAHTVPIDGIRATDTSRIGLRLTELGTVLVGQHLKDQGYPIPELGEFVDENLEEFIQHAATWPPARIRREFTVWVAHRGVDVAIAELCRVADSTRDPGTRAATASLAAGLGDNAERAVRALLGTAASGHAHGWLVQEGLEAPVIEDEAQRRASLLALIDMIAVHCTSDPDDDAELRPIFASLFDVPEAPVEELLSELVRIDDHWAAEVLSAIGRLAPDRDISKRARKALHRHRSRTGTNHLR